MNDKKSVPDPSQGWTPDRPSEDPELRIERITVVRFDDGSTRKFYLMRVRPSVLKEKKELLKKKLKQVGRSLRQHEQTLAKQKRNEARVWVALLGR